MKYLLTILISLSFSSISLANHIDVDAWDYIPEVEIEVVKDNMSGWNLEVVSTNFIFDPANASGPHQIGHGHAHLFINGQKAARLYGNWYHISSKSLKMGQNNISVSLNANTHEFLKFRGQTIQDSAIVLKTSNGGGHGGGHDHDHLR